MSSKDSKAYIPLRRKTIRVGSSRWLRTPQFHVGNTNMLVSKNALHYPWPKAKAKIVVTPNANPLREQVEYRWRWVPNARGWSWACRFHFVYFLFPCFGYPTRTQFPVEYGLNSNFEGTVKQKTTTKLPDVSRDFVPGKTFETYLISLGSALYRLLDVSIPRPILNNTI